MTPWERTLWRALKQSFLAIHWRKQVPLGPYTADFACHSAKLVIELDGSQHGADAAIASDAVRTRFLENEGYRVIRFWNNDVTANLDGVIARIANALSTSPLVGEVARRAGGARDASTPHENTPLDESKVFQPRTRLAPTFRPPHKGEETKGKPPVGVR